MDWMRIGFSPPTAVLPMRTSRVVCVVQCSERYSRDGAQPWLVLSYPSVFLRLGRFVASTDVPVSVS